MNKEVRENSVTDSRMGRVMLVAMMLFFVYLGDAVLSDFVPAFMQKSLKSSLFMGLIMSFSSMVGLAADLVFPQLLKSMKTKRLMLMAMGTSLVFSGVLLWSTVWPVIIIFLLAMAVWGIYYEFLGFGGSQFVGEAVPRQLRSSAWAMMGVFKSLAYFLGPVIGSWAALKLGNAEVILIAVGFVLIGYLVWRLTEKKWKEQKEPEEVEKINVWMEMSHWRTLAEHIWPVLTISIFLGLIDATFWTTGTVLSDVLAEKHSWGGMFLPFYMLPMIFVRVVIAKKEIYQGKKKMAEKAMLLAGAFLILVGLTESVIGLMLVSLLIGIALSVAWPMTDAVYSDIIARMGKEKKHMVGLSSSTLSLAYIIGPILAGAIASKVGERTTFSVIGVMTVAAAIFLLMTTPRKLKLPQEEIKAWKD